MTFSINISNAAQDTNNAVIFSDGSSRGNPGPGGWGAIVSAGGKVKELGGGADPTTNNKMELTGALKGLEFLKDTQSGVLNVTLYTDSSYLVNGMMKWVRGWQANGWVSSLKKPVENRELWEALVAAADGLEITYTRIDGHRGIPGNERCDEIATGFADGAAPVLYDASASAYTVDLTKVVAPAGTVPKKKSSSKLGQKAFKYVSLVNGVFKEYDNWGSCEAEVKGKRGAKFQKVFSQNELDALKGEWLGKI